MVDGQLSLAEVDLGTIGSKESSKKSIEAVGLSLVDKYLDLSVTEKRISKEDTEFLKNLEDEYNTLRDDMSTLKSRVEGIYNKAPEDDWLQYSDVLREISKDTASLNLKYVSRTIAYFQEKYGVEIDYYKLEEKFRRYHDEGKHIQSYNEILDEILAQLNGKTFSELAKEQTIEKYSDLISKNSEIKFKKSSVKFTSYFVSYSDIWERYEVESYNRYSYSKFIDFISYFEGADKGLLEQIMRRGLEGHTGSHATKEFFDTKEFTKVQKIKSIKFYKNRKVLIKFNSHEYAEEFYNTFCL